MIYSEGIWKLCFRQILITHKKSSSDEWTKRVDVIVKSWNLQHYQENAEVKKQPRMKIKKTLWKQTLREMQKKLVKQQLNGWNKRFDRLRSNWQDRGERMKGGLSGMENRITEKIGMKDLRTMLEEQHFKCALTGEELTPDNCVLDHILPLAQGGHHIKSNAQLVCSAVNRAKGQMREDEFIKLCFKVTENARNKTL